MKRWIAADFGTTNSAVAHYGPRGPEVIKIEGQELVPSIVTIVGDKVEVGQKAVAARKRNPQYSYASFKRHMGEAFNPEEMKDTQMTAGPDGMLHYVGPDGFTYTPVELASYVYIKLRAAAEAKLKTDADNIVATVPATYTQPQRDAIRMACIEAGFEQVELMDEPTAAAIAYGYDFDHAHRIAVLDVGGGTTDCAFIETGRGLVRVMATNGTPFVGGDDWDRHVRSLVLNMHELHNEDSSLATRPDAMRILLTEAESAKRRLTDDSATEVRVMDIDKDRHSGEDIHVIETITREMMDEATTRLLADIQAAMERTVAEARAKDPKFTVRDLDTVILVGGQTRVRAIQELVRDFFGQEPRTDVDPEIAVVLGAAVRAGILEGRKGDLTIKDITAHAYALETHARPEDVATELARKGTPYGTRATYWLSNRDDAQEKMTVRLYQGDHVDPAQCVMLWEHHIDIEPGAAKGERVQLDIEIGPSGEAIVDIHGENIESVSYGRAA